MNEKIEPANSAEAEPPSESAAGASADSTTSSAQRASGGGLALLLIPGLLLTLAVSLAIYTGTKGNFEFHGTSGKLAVVGAVPEFSLVERSGATVTLDDLNGQIWIADFIFTRCGGTCPIMTRSMARLRDSLNGIPELWPPARLVSFTVDPDYDTPEVLDRFAKGHGIEGNQWLFLTGPYEEIQQLALAGFKLPVEATGGSPEEPIIHSQRLVLVDGDARIRGYYDGTDSEAQLELMRDVARLLRERR